MHGYGLGFKGLMKAQGKVTSFLLAREWPSRQFCSNSLPFFPASLPPSPLPSPPPSLLHPNPAPAGYPWR